jgi:hypothetical protein
MTRRHRFAALSLLAALACPLAGGCGVRTTTVTGRVTYRGQPVANGSVILYCADKQIVRGNLGAGGAFAIPNVPPGVATVTVQTHARVPAGLQIAQDPPPSSGGPVLPTPGQRDPEQLPIPPRYALPDESGLTVSVGNGPVTFDIDLKP